VPPFAIVTVAGEKPLGPYVTVAFIGAALTGVLLAGVAVVGAVTAVWSVVAGAATGALDPKYHHAPSANISTITDETIVDVFIYQPVYHFD
jgi:mannose/fructose/N-acetylgalactosamine-specific phosphotransferase system component IIC